MITTTTPRQLALLGASLLSMLLLAGAARAGGHLDVDDAGMLDPGQCQYETWYGRAGAEPFTVLHFGPTCRVGPVELGLNLDRFRIAGEPHAFAIGPQIKWTWFGQSPDALLSGAVAAGASWDRTNRGRPGRQLLFPFTWRATDSLQVHLNLGADWAPVTGERTGRGGVGTEWAVTEQVALLAERHRAGGQWTSRAGARINLTPLISVDLTASQTTRPGPGHRRGFYVGLNHEFTRP